MPPRYPAAAPWCGWCVGARADVTVGWLPTVVTPRLLGPHPLESCRATNGPSQLHLTPRPFQPYVCAPGMPTAAVDDDLLDGCPTVGTPRLLSPYSLESRRATNGPSRLHLLPRPLLSCSYAPGVSTAAVNHAWPPVQCGSVQRSGLQVTCRDGRVRVSVCAKKNRAARNGRRRSDTPGWV